MEISLEQVKNIPDALVQSVSGADDVPENILEVVSEYIYSNGVVNSINAIDWEVFCASKSALVDKDKAEIFYWIARSLSEEDEPALSIEAYTQAIFLSPDNNLYLNSRGVARFESGDLEGAIEDYTAVINSTGASKTLILKYNPASLENRANARLKLNDLEGALSDFNLLIDLNPDDHISISTRGWINVQYKNFDSALEDYSNAIKTTEKSGYSEASYYKGRGCAFALNGDLDQALRDLYICSRLDPDSEEIKHLINSAKQDILELKGSIPVFDSEFPSPSHQISVSAASELVSINKKLRDGDKRILNESIVSGEIDLDEESILMAIEDIQLQVITSDEMQYEMAKKYQLLAKDIITEEEKALFFDEHFQAFNLEINPDLDAPVLEVLFEHYGYSGPNVVKKGEEMKAWIGMWCAENGFPISLLNCVT